MSDDTRALFRADWPLVPTARRTPAWPGYTPTVADPSRDTAQSVLFQVRSVRTTSLGFSMRSSRMSPACAGHVAVSTEDEVRLMIAGIGPRRHRLLSRGESGVAYRIFSTFVTARPG